MTIEDQQLSIPRRVFITGARGFIGRTLARRYRELGAEVSGIDFSADPEWGVLAGDLAQPDTWRDALVGVDLVIHTAAIVSNTASMDQAWQVNVKGTADLLSACVEAKVRRFVQLSSVAAFGFNFPDGVSEDHPLRPMGNTYVDTKIASEHAVLACHASGRMDCTIIRPGDVYGPGSRPWVIIPLEMIQQGKFLLPAHGQGIFSPVYIDDLVDGLVLAAGQDAGRGQIYTISGSAGVSCEEYFGYHARMLGLTRPARKVSTGFAIALAETVRWLVQLFGGQTELGRGTIDMLSRNAGYSIEKARLQLGYEPQVDLEEGMRRTEQWAREQKLI
ncbi:MAG: NAD-dependent epimerase/dehydratase family protein [Gammaproteobacteria bacterium]|nr:NAD-dependent epimerase/dehydratase family protein [Gammaproteobacteria bacterium]